MRSFIRPSVPPSPSLPFSQTPIPVRPETTELYQWDAHPVPDPVSDGARDQGARLRSKGASSTSNEIPSHMMPTSSSKAKARYGFETGTELDENAARDVPTLGGGENVALDQPWQQSSVRFSAQSLRTKSQRSSGMHIAHSG